MPQILREQIRELHPRALAAFELRNSNGSERDECKLFPTLKKVLKQLLFFPSFLICPVLLDDLIGDEVDGLIPD